MPRYAKFRAGKDAAPRMGKVVREADAAELDHKAIEVKSSPSLVAKKVKGAKGKKKAKKAKKLNA